MKIKFLLHCAKISAASLLIVGLSFAQSSQPTTARKSVSVILHDRQDAREANSGMATGRRQYSPTVQTIDPNNSTQRKNSAHATEPLNQPASAAKGENPLYEDAGKSGTNPLYGSKDRTTSPATTTAEASKKHPASVKYQNRTADGAAAGQQSSTSTDTETFKQDFGQVQANKR